MSDFWQQVQEHEQQEFEAMLEKHREDLQWLNRLNKQISSGYRTTIKDQLNQLEIKI